ncbi:MAG TPA: glycosyltransferase family 4 protein, partial [Patescibacteria group bacterium]|nr:glycosyltransferase family 4 protein [Patescibacteria group bacterium]
MPTTNILYLTVKGLRFTSSQQLGLFVRRFSSGRYRCHVATYKPLDASGELAALGVGAHQVPGLREWRRWSAIWRRPATLRALQRIVREHDIHLIHSFQTSSAPYAMTLSRRTGVPHIVQFRNTYNDRAHYMRFGLHRARVLLTLSDTMMERYVDLVGTAARRDQRRVVIPNGIEVDEYRRRGLARDVRAELGFKPEQPVVGIVGALSSRKDSLLSIDVAARLRAAGIEAKFVFIGGFSDEQYGRRVVETIERLGLKGTCILAGHQPDAAPYFRAMDLLLHTAWREGHAKVFNEAMVFARPIVTSRITGTVDVIEDGSNGILCEPGDAGAFAEAVASLIGSPARR